MGEPLFNNSVLIFQAISLLAAETSKDLNLFLIKERFLLANILTFNM